MNFRNLLEQTLQPSTQQSPGASGGRGQIGLPALDPLPETGNDGVGDVMVGFRCRTNFPNAKPIR